MALSSDDVGKVYIDAVATYTNETTKFVERLQQFADREIEIPKIRGGRSYFIPSSKEEMIAELESSKPVKPTGLAFNAPVNPGVAPDNFTIREAAAVSIPTFADTPPEINIGTAPTLTLPSEPTAPSIKDVTTPVAPDIELPPLPTLTDVNFPSAPSLTIPVFSEKFPELDDDLLLQTDKFEWENQDYQNDVMDQISVVLLDDLFNGGFGVIHTDEEELYERQKDRQVQEGKARETEIVNTFASRGFQLPPGTLINLVDANIQDTHNKLSEANRDISTQRAELLRKGREFAITQGLSLNELLIRDHGFKQERLLNAARFTAEFAITVADYEVKRYNTYIQAFTSYAQSYEAQIRAVLARTEIFKTEVDAAVSKQTSNKLEVDIYTAQIGAVDLLVKLFETQMRASQVEVEIEKSKIDAFQSRVQAFTAQVNAQKTTVEAFESSVRGELAKSEVYKSQVGAFESQVRAASVQADIQNKNVDADIDKAKLQLSTYETQIRKYKADLDQELSRVGSLSSIYNTDTDVFKAIMASWGAVTNAETQVHTNALNSIALDQKLDQSADQIRANNILKQMEIKAAAAKGGTDVFTYALGAAQNIFNIQNEVE